MAQGNEHRFSGQTIPGFLSRLGCVTLGRLLWFSDASFLICCCKN